MNMLLCFIVISFSSALPVHSCLALCSIQGDFSSVHS